MTQFGRALAELNIEILCANSSQAKGRVERASRGRSLRAQRERSFTHHGSRCKQQISAKPKRPGSMPRSWFSSAASTQNLTTGRRENSE
jgi:hypothetical protein